MSAGIPVKLLSEAQGHIVSLELNSGETYRGKLIESEDNMNVQLKDITVTTREGKVSHLEHVFVRGSTIRFFLVPEMLRNAPMFDPNHTKPPPPIRGPKEDDSSSSYTHSQFIPNATFFHFPDDIMTTMY